MFRRSAPKFEVPVVDWTKVRGAHTGATGFRPIMTTLFTMGVIWYIFPFTAFFFRSTQAEFWFLSFYTWRDSTLRGIPFIGRPHNAILSEYTPGDKVKESH